jgi:NAD-dependent deacetylase
MMDELIRKAAELIISSKNMTVFAGAGLSQESGIPVFRGDEGIWKNFLPIIYGNPAGLVSAFVFSPGKFREFIDATLKAFVQADPNPGHLALGELSRAGILKAVITQNVDDLEKRAGVKEVVQLHGSIYQWRCIQCKEHSTVSRESMIGVAAQLQPGMGRKELIDLGHKVAKCPNCEGWRRPDIVLFGEKLDQEVFFRAVELARASDLMLILGTSGVVYPAALIPNYARKAGAKIIEVNPEDSSVSDLAEIKIRSNSAATLPQILSAMREINPDIFKDKPSG